MTPSPQKAGLKSPQQIRKRPWMPKNYDNPYAINSAQKLDGFREKMRNIVDLYLYMTFPDRDPRSHRPPYQPFLYRSLTYMRKNGEFFSTDDENRTANSTSTHAVQHKVSPKKRRLVHSSPTVTFTKLKNDRMVDCKIAYVQCFTVSETDGTLSKTNIVKGAFFEANLDRNLKVKVDLISFVPELPSGVRCRNNYLVLKVKFLTDAINVSGGRRLRSVPARQAAHIDDPAESKNGSQIMFAAAKITTMKAGQSGHYVREGKRTVALIQQEKLGVDGDSLNWYDNCDLVRNVLAESRKPGEYASIAMDIFQDARCSLDEDDTSDEEEEDRCAVAEIKARRPSIDGSFSSRSNSAHPPNWVHDVAPDTKVGSHQGILAIVPEDLRERWLNARVPEKLAWCFRMTSGSYTAVDAKQDPAVKQDPDFGSELPEDDLFQPKQETADNNENILSVLTNAENVPPADVFRFTGNECFFCQVKRPFPCLTAFLYHLSTVHGRLSFSFKENLVPMPIESNVESPRKRKRGESAADRQCHGIIVSLNTKYDGSHEFDTTRHFRKTLPKELGGPQIRKIVGAWDQPPCFIVTKCISKHLRRFPPSTSIDNVLFNTNMNEGTFGGHPLWLDRHFHTERYANASSSFKKVNQRRRIEEFIDVNQQELDLFFLLSDFSCTFRTIPEPRLTYGVHRIMVEELRDSLMQQPYYFQFFVHLCNQKDLGRLNEAEWHDIVSRLQQGPNYEPRADRKHFVYFMLKALEAQRPIQLALHRKRRKDASADPSLEGEDGEEGDNSSGDSSVKVKLEPVSNGSQAAKLRVNNTNCGPNVKTCTAKTSSATPDENSSGPSSDNPACIPLPPEQVEFSSLEELQQRYPFAKRKNLKTIWHFMRKWTRELVEWQ